MMLTPAFLVIVLAASPPPSAIAKPGASAARGLQPSPERVEGFKITIAKRRKRRAELHRLAESSRRALRQQPMASDRLRGISAARPSTPFPSGDPFPVPFLALVPGEGSTTPGGDLPTTPGIGSARGGGITCVSGAT
jgi:hypothetical protein